MNLKREEKIQKLLNQYNLSFNSYLREVMHLLLNLKKKKISDNKLTLLKTKENSENILTYYDLLLSERKTAGLELLRQELPKKFSILQAAIASYDIEETEKKANEIAVIFDESLRLLESLFDVHPAIKTTFLKTSG